MSNLWQYFKQRGETLPSIEERRRRYGLGPEYSGTAQQNIALLQRLGGGGGIPATQVPASQAQAPAQQAPADTGWRGQMAEIEKYRGQQMEQAGISGLRTSISGLRKEVGRTEELLESLRPDIEKRTQDFLVPEAYRRRMEAVEREPLATQLAGLTRGLGIQEQALSGRMGEIDYRTQLASQLMREELAHQRSLESKTAGRTGTAGERAKQSARQQAELDASQGATSEQLARAYGSVLEPWELLQIYNEANYYKSPIKDVEGQFYKWLPGYEEKNKKEGVWVDAEGNIHFD